MPPAVLYQPGGYSLASIVSGYKGTLRPNQFYNDHLSIQGRRSLRLMATFTF
jgi:hypothetical protein